MVGQRRHLQDHGHDGHSYPEDGRSRRDFWPARWLLVVNQARGVAIDLARGL